MARTPRFDGRKPVSPTASKTMSRNRRADTSCEVLLRGALWRRGLRFRKNVTDLPGKPDVVFPRARVVVFCDGDFWHGKDWAARKRKLRNGHNADYWVAKIETNIRRDRHNEKQLREDGWVVVRVWESEIIRDTECAVMRVEAALKQTGTG